MALASNTVYGQPLVIRVAGGQIGLKWTVSVSEPKSPKAGDIWVVGNKADIPINKVIHLQADSNTVANPQPNTIYVIIPSMNFEKPLETVKISFFDNKKYKLSADCPYIFVTNSSGKVLDVSKAVYTGTAWKYFGTVPEQPKSWAKVAILTENTQWTPPENNTYRVTVIGKSADGTKGGDLPLKQELEYQQTAKGGNGGGAGGLACSILKLTKSNSVHCTINEVITSFGEHLSATAAQGTAGGSGSNGTEFNTVGGNGGNGGRGENTHGENGANGGGVLPSKGCTGGSKGILGNGQSGSGGGGGGAYQYSNSLKYDDPLYTNYIQFDLSNFQGGRGANDGNGNPGASYPAFDINNPKWYGGGNGGGGAHQASSGRARNGGAGSAGSPGGIIIEKAIW